MAHLETARGTSTPKSIVTRLRENLAQKSWLSLLIGLAILALWEWASRAGWITALFFPPPLSIVRTIVRLISNGVLIKNATATLARVGLGLLLGGVPGLLLGLGMGWSPRLRMIIDPFVAATHPIPKIAILPLIMIIFGIGETSKVVVVALASFFPILINTMAGVGQIHPIYFEVAENYGAHGSKVFSHVILPGSLPLVLSGIRLALNSALLIAVAVELVAAQQGLGAMIWFAWETLRTAELYASLAVAAVLGIGFNVFLERMALYLTPWQKPRG